jgi:uncharacterized membrane protein YcjF (UPF0283 family)
MLQSEPYFDLSGTDEKDKILKVYESDYWVPNNEMIRDTLIWLKRYFDPVNKKFKATMAKKKIEDLNTETLLKRKKLAIWLLWLMLFAVLLTLSAGVYDYYTEDEFNVTTFLASISACSAAAIALFAGLKKLREELDRRA